MLWSQLSIQTLREETHPPLVRAGYKRGTEYLFLGQRALEKIRGLGDVQVALAECGVPYVCAGADLVVEDPNGDDILVRGHEYADLLGRAVSIAQPPGFPDPEGDLAPEEFHTPGVKTIAQIAAFSRLPPTSQIKSVVMVAGGALILVLLRGDHQLSETKLEAVLRTPLEAVLRTPLEAVLRTAGDQRFQIRPATPEELRASFGADAGSLGPIFSDKVGHGAGAANVRILADEALRGRRDMVSGANRNDYHLRNVTPGEDFAAEFFDLRQAAEGDRCVTDGGPLTFTPALVIRDAESALAVAVEKNRDADGIVLPPSIAPFTAVVTPVHPDRLEAARKIYEDLRRAGVDALLDDRDARPGVKFKDADLIGIPYRINVGKKLAEGLVEFMERSPRRSTDVPVGEIRIPR